MEMYRCPGCMDVTANTVCEKCGWPMGKNNEVHQLPVGTRLRGQYVIGRVLGQGGFGITYLGWDDMLDMPVAIKEFYPNAMVTRECTVSTAVHCTSEQVLPGYDASKERFLREAKALARLRDVPEVVGIHGFFEENGTAYIIMEYVKGTDLATYIARKGGRLSPEETFRILRPVMEALEMVHQAELVHRDISPDNIMLHPRGGAKLLDFGAVRNVEGAEAGKDMAHSTEAILKHGFAPAEQYKSKGGLGPWSDEYAMCATVYYCLTGRIPPQAVERMLEDVEVRFDIPGLPLHQREALEKGMAIRSQDRHGSMKKLMEALFLTEEPTSFKMPAVMAPVAAPVTSESVAVPEEVSEPAAVAEENAPVSQESLVAQLSAAKATKRKRLLVGIGMALTAVLLVILLIPKGWYIRDGQYVYYENGIKKTSSWLHEGDNWFFFDSDGNMAIGWRDIAGIRYYLLDNGVMATGWQTIGDERYYFNPTTGELTTGLQTIDGKEYYFADNGEMLTGWQMINGDKSYFSANGEWVKGWANIDGEKYYFLPDGKPARDFRSIDGERYYFDPETGELTTGWQTVNGSKHFFEKGSGVMAVGWKTINYKKYYFFRNGKLATGWQTINGKRYYFDSDTGEMATGWKGMLAVVRLGEWEWVKYYFSYTGEMATGWQRINGYRYYFGPDGGMYTGSHMIDGRYYYFGSDGKLR